jgi:hypothetical protein
MSKEEKLHLFINKVKLFLRQIGAIVHKTHKTDNFKEKAQCITLIMYLLIVKAKSMIKNITI